MLTSNVFSKTAVCHCHIIMWLVSWWEVNQSGQTLQCQKHLFRAFVLSQIRDDRSERVFFAQMTSCPVRYDVIYFLSIFGYCPDTDLFKRCLIYLVGTWTFECLSLTLLLWNTRQTTPMKLIKYLYMTRWSCVSVPFVVIFTLTLQE